MGPYFNLFEKLGPKFLKPRSDLYLKKKVKYLIKDPTNLMYDLSKP